VPPILAVRPQLHGFVSGLTAGHYLRSWPTAAGHFPSAGRLAARVASRRRPTDSWAALSQWERPVDEIEQAVLPHLAIASAVPWMMLADAHYHLWKLCASTDRWKNGSMLAVWQNHAGLNSAVGPPQRVSRAPASSSHPPFAQRDRQVLRRANRRPKARPGRPLQRPGCPTDHPTKPPRTGRRRSEHAGSRTGGSGTSIDPSRAAWIAGPIAWSAERAGMSAASAKATPWDPLLESIIDKAGPGTFGKVCLMVKLRFHASRFVVADDANLCSTNNSFSDSTFKVAPCPIAIS
jgi:hypothetical protein